MGCLLILMMVQMMVWVKNLVKENLKMMDLMMVLQKDQMLG